MLEELTKQFIKDYANTYIANCDKCKSIVNAQDLIIYKDNGYCSNNCLIGDKK